MIPIEFCVCSAPPLPVLPWSLLVIVRVSFVAEVLKFKSPRYWRPVAFANVVLIALCVPVSVMVLVPFPTTLAAVTPVGTSVRIVSLPWSTDSATMMFCVAGFASTSVTDTPVIANVVSSFPDGDAGRWFTGASFTASMFSVVVVWFWPPLGTFGAPSLTVQVMVRVVLAP